MELWEVMINIFCSHDENGEKKRMFFHSTCRWECPNSFDTTIRGRRCHPWIWPRYYKVNRLDHLQRWLPSSQLNFPPPPPLLRRHYFHPLWDLKQGKSYQAEEGFSISKAEKKIYFFHSSFFPSQVPKRETVKATPPQYQPAFWLKRIELTAQMIDESPCRICIVYTLFSL